MPNKTLLNSLSPGMVSLVAMSLYIGGAVAPVLAQQSDEDDLSFADIAVCLPGLVDVPSELREEPSGDADEQPIAIEADQIEASDGKSVTLSGNAQIVQGNRGVYADRIDYDQESYRATAKGNVVMYTPGGDEIKAESMNIEVDTFIGDAERVSIKLVETSPQFLNRRSENFEEDYSVFAPFRNRIEPAGADDEDADNEPEERKYYQRARASGDTMQFEGKDYEVLQNAVMTTCPEGNEDVMLSAKELELDHATGIGTAKNMVVRLKNVPIFYFPSVSFPINDERKTGFLFPGFGEEKESGVIVEIPYYINIAPHMDATITPRLLTERGVQVYSEMRYIGEDAEGAVKAEYLPGDDQFNGEDRHAFGFDHDQRFGDNWRALVDLQDVSDSQYLRDFANNVDVVASSFVPQTARLTRTGEMFNFSSRVRTTESVNDDIATSALPYDILPELNLDLKPQELGIIEAGVKTQLVEFDHEDGARVTGQRRKLNPYLSLPLEEIYGYVKPKVSLYNISYSLTNNTISSPVDPDGLDPDQPDFEQLPGDDAPSATIPVYSVDSGLTFERLFERNGNPYYQTLEPRLFYLNVPEETDQNAFPVFDTSETTLSSFGQFFRENRFFGGDRVGDTEQLSVGLTSRVVNDDDGSQRLKASIGQVYYLSDRNIKLNNQDPDTEGESDIIAELTANYREDWSFTGFTRWDVDNSELGTIRLSADYFNSLRRNASVAYSETRDVSQQINFDFVTPLGPRWQLDVDTAYSLEDDELRSSSVGLVFDGCCWAAKVKTQRYLDGTGEYKNRFLFTLELDDLGKIRSSL